MSSLPVWLWSIYLHSNNKLITGEPVATHWACPHLAGWSLFSHISFSSSPFISSFTLGTVSLPTPDPPLCHCTAAVQATLPVCSHVLLQHAGDPLHLCPVLLRTSACMLPSEPGAGLLQASCAEDARQLGTRSGFCRQTFLSCQLLPQITTQRHY